MNKKNNRIIMVCNICLNRNYRIFKNKTNVRLVLKKYCSSCNRHTVHKETR